MAASEPGDLVTAKSIIGQRKKYPDILIDPTALRPRIIASMLLHAVGDTLGYRNGLWEFNEREAPYGMTEEHRVEYEKTRYDPNITKDRVYEFLELGGINNIDLTGWKVSDDAVLNLATAQAFLTHLGNPKRTNKNDMELFCDTLVEEYVKQLPNLMGRHIGITTQQVLEQYKAGETWRDNHPVRLNEVKGAGNGAAIRTIPIGLVLFAESERESLVIMALEASRVTHNHPIGYLGGICAALFTAFAIEGRPIESWYPEMHKVLRAPGDNSPLRKYLARTSGLKEYDRDSVQWWAQWETYTQAFAHGSEYKNRVGNDPVARIKWFRDHLGFRFGSTGFVGRGGHDSVIIAYDSLVRTVKSGCGWEKLIYLAALHSGDSDSTGCIAGAWYGAMFGIGGVPANMLRHLEYREHLEDLGSSLSDMVEEIYLGKKPKKQDLEKRKRQ